MVRFVCTSFVASALVSLAVVAHASGPTEASAPGPFFGDASSGPTPTLRPHQYTLAECLALSDRNFPNLWAARARLAYAHAQLDEAVWAPWFQWSAQSSFGVAPPLQGTVIYPTSSAGTVSYRTSRTRTTSSPFCISA